MDQDYLDVVEAYRDQSEEELLNTLAEMTDEEKKAGRLNNTKLDEIYEMLYPYLTEKQRSKMEQVLARLKE
ncbi:MAG: hypothetical protein IJF41_01195 [Clostridia bacterium]|nr:hypothetical protein [Clostridia bacterium]